MKVGDIVRVNLDQSVLRGSIIGIPVNRGKLLYKIELTDLSTIPQWFEAANVLPD